MAGYILLACVPVLCLVSSPSSRHPNIVSLAAPPEEEGVVQLVWQAGS